MLIRLKVGDIFNFEGNLVEVTDLLPDDALRYRYLDNSKGPHYMHGTWIYINLNHKYWIDIADFLSNSFRITDTNDLDDALNN